MAAKTIETQVHGVVALIAECFSVRMAFPATIEGYRALSAVAHNLALCPFTHHAVSDFQQKVHVLKTHVRNIFDTLFLSLGHLQKRLLDLGAG